MGGPRAASRRESAGDGKVERGTLRIRVEAPAGEKGVAGSPTTDRLFRKDLPVLPGRYRTALGQENGTAYLHGGGSEVRDGVVLGQDGEYQCLGTTGGVTLLAPLVGRASLQCRLPGSRACSAGCRRPSPRNSPPL